MSRFYVRIVKIDDQATIKYIYIDIDINLLLILKESN